MKHFIEWDSVDLRVNGDRLNDLVQAYRIEPVERLGLRFDNGLLRVSGTIRKLISVPFQVDVREIRAEGRTIRVPLRSVSAFGVIPIPKFLFGLIKSRLPADLVRYEEPATLVISLDPFLLPFVDTEIQNVWIIDGGLAVTLGRGSADMPKEESYGSDHDH